MATSTDGTAALERCLQELYVPAMRAQDAAVARQAVAESPGYPDYLREPAQPEYQQREQRRIERLFKGSILPRRRVGRRWI